MNRIWTLCEETEYRGMRSGADLGPIRQVLLRPVPNEPDRLQDQSGVAGQWKDAGAGSGPPRSLRERGVQRESGDSGGPDRKSAISAHGSVL